MWQFPDRSAFPINHNKEIAVGDEVFISGISNPGAVILHRGSTHFSPDGEHCCARFGVEIDGVIVPVMEVVRRCVTFSELLTIIIFSVQY